MVSRFFLFFVCVVCVLYYLFRLYFVICSLLCFVCCCGCQWSKNTCLVALITYAVTAFCLFVCLFFVAFYGVLIICFEVAKTIDLVESIPTVPILPCLSDIKFYFQRFSYIDAQRCGWKVPSGIDQPRWS